MVFHILHIPILTVWWYFFSSDNYYTKGKIDGAADASAVTINYHSHGTACQCPGHVSCIESGDDNGNGVNRHMRCSNYTVCGINYWSRKPPVGYKCTAIICRLPTTYVESVVVGDKIYTIGNP